VAALRSAQRPAPAGARPVVVGDVGPDTDWSEAVAGVRCVIHLAARVHAMRDEAPDPLAEHRRVNLSGTMGLARAAAAAGARRLVFVSTVKVMGEGRELPYGPSDSPAPVDPYATSKWEAEQALRSLAEASGLEVVVVRPVLVYGPGVRANFLRLLQLVDRELPIPFGAVQNRRSLLFVGNLADALRVAASAPVAAGTPYFLSDGSAVSTPQLVRSLAAAMGRRPRLLAIPPWLMRGGLTLLGKRAVANRVLGSLTVDPSAFQATAGWAPPCSFEEGVSRTVEWYLRSGAGRAHR